MRDRRQFDCHVRRLLQEYGFIRDLNALVQSQVADIVHHETRREGDILFRQGDEPNNCYIILVGEVHIWQRKTLHNHDPDTPGIHEGTLSVRTHAEAILSILIEEKRSAEADNPELRKRREKRDEARKRDASRRKENAMKAIQGSDPSEYSQVAALGSAMMFGEVGLLDDQPRSATIRCNMETELLVIKKTDFDRVLKAAVNRLRLRKLAGPMRTFLKGFDFFGKLEPEVQHQVPEILHYVHYRKGSLVYREGDKPEHLHIILTGQVTFWKKDAEKNEDGPPPAQVAGTSLKMKTAAMLSRLHENEEYRHQQDWVETGENVDFEKLGAPTSLLGCGFAFGERALIEDSPQVATVTCSQDCEFLTIHKSDFDSLLKQRMQEANMALPYIINPLLQIVPIFQKLGKPVQENLSFSMAYVRMARGEVLFWEGTQPTNCYFLLSGSVGVWKLGGNEDSLCGLGKQQEIVSGSIALCEKCVEVCKAINEIERPAHFIEIIKMAVDLKKMQKQEEANDAKNKSQYEKMGMQIGLSGEGSVFGDQALMNDTPQTETVTCAETCKLLVVSKYDFDRVVKQELLRAKVKQLSTTVRRLLTEFDLFRDLQPSVQENIAAIVHYVPMRAGQLVFEQGNQPDYCYIILSGEVTVWIAKTNESQRLARRAAVEMEHLDKDRSSIEDDDLIDEEAPALSPTFTRPAVMESSQQALEKCEALATMLGSFGGQGLSTIALAQHSYMDISTLAYNNSAVASLGPGAIFGELALLNNKPRNATISCWTNCAFLAMERADFDKLLKEDMKKAKQKKLEFVRSVVPGARNLAVDIIDKMLYYFTKETVPRNHVFIEQGEVLDGSLYFIWDGSVESYLHDPTTGGFVNRGIMLQGSLFAALPQGTHSTFTIVSKSSPCEVLHVKPESRKHLPDAVLRSLRVVIEQQLERRSTQSLPLSPLGSVFPRAQTASQTKKQLPTSRSGKVPRPLSGKIPAIAGRSTSAFDSPMLRRPRTGSMHCSLPSFAGLFQREITEVDYEAFCLEPGETIAITAKKPKRRKQKNMVESSSLPALKGA